MLTKYKTGGGNIKVFSSSLADIQQRAEQKLHISAKLPTPYKLCDFRPIYGIIFEDYLRG